MDECSFMNYVVVGSSPVAVNITTKSKKNSFDKFFDGVRRYVVSVL